MTKGQVVVSERFFVEFLGKLWDRPDAFMRELLSNAHSAILKRAYLDEAYSQRQPVPPQAAIDIQVQRRERRIRIDDNGAGLMPEDFRQLGQLGTSLTDQFRRTAAADASSLTGAQREQLLGQIGYWGVGLYSALTAAAAFDVISRGLGSDRTYVWTCRRDGTWSLTDLEDRSSAEADAYREFAGRGAGTTLLLRDVEHDDFLDEDRVREAVLKYADFFPYPVRVGGVAVNRRRVPWDGRNPDKADLDEFYRSRFPGAPAPLAAEFFHVSSPVDARGVLFLTEQPVEEGLTLLVQRVPLLRHYGLLPEWAEGMVCGFVDSSDIPLTATREAPRPDSREYQGLQNLLAKQLYKLLERLEERPQTLREVWRAHGPRLTAALHGDPAACRRVGRSVLLFPSSRRKSVSLNEYASRATSERTDVERVTVWYAPAEWRGTSAVEALDRRDIEVLFTENAAIEQLLLSFEDADAKTGPRLDIRRVDDAEDPVPPNDARPQADEPARPVNSEAGQLLRSSLEQALGPAVAGVALGAFQPASEPVRLVRPPLPAEVRQFGPMLEALGRDLTRYRHFSRDTWPPHLQAFVTEAETAGVSVDDLLRNEIGVVQKRRLVLNWDNPDIQRLAAAVQRLCDGGERSSEVLQALAGHLLLMARLHGGVPIEADVLAQSSAAGRTILKVLLDQLARD
jgi:molecular chaperone HtpG